MSRLEWDQTGESEMAGTKGRLLWVGDGHLGYAALLPEDAEVPAALEDFAAGYETDHAGTVHVRWTLYEDGAEVRSGKWSFNVD